MNTPSFKRKKEVSERDKKRIDEALSVLTDREKDVFLCTQRRVCHLARLRSC